MNDHIPQEPDPDFPAVGVDQRWDPHIRSWTTTWIDADGAQTGPAAFSGNRADAAADKAFYVRTWGRHVFEPTRSGKCNECGRDKGSHPNMKVGTKA